MYNVHVRCNWCFHVLPIQRPFNNWNKLAYYIIGYRMFLDKCARATWIPKHFVRESPLFFMYGYCTDLLEISAVRMESTMNLPAFRPVIQPSVRTIRSRQKCHHHPKKSPSRTSSHMIDGRSVNFVTWTTVVRPLLGERSLKVFIFWLT
jgi:hypothetical protein